MTKKISYNAGRYSKSLTDFIDHELKEEDDVEYEKETTN